MKYKVVLVFDKLNSWYLVNCETHKTHSVWRTLKQAREALDDLNKWTKETK